MIDIDLVDEPAGFKYPWLGGKWNLGSFGMLELLDYLVVLTPQEHGIHEQLFMDSLSQGGESRGRLRDKSVSHFSAQGHIEVASKRVVAGIDSTGAYALRSDGSKVHYCSLLYWGSETIRDEVHLSYSSNPVYTVWRRRGFKFQGSKLIGFHSSWYTSSVNPSPYNVSTYWYYVEKRNNSTECWSRMINAGRVLADVGDMQGKLDNWPTSGFTRQLNYSDIVVQNYGDPEVLLNIIKGNIAHSMKSQDLLLAHPTDFGELALDCCKQLRFTDRNILLLFCDIDTIRNFKAVMKHLFNPRAWGDAWVSFQAILNGVSHWRDFVLLFRPGSSMYLFSKYVVLPDIDDIKRLTSGITDFLSRPWFQRLHSRRVTAIESPFGSSATHTAVLTVQVANWPDNVLSKIQQFISDCKGLGIYPEVQNLWDILPYSFVIDWIIQFGDLFEDVDNYLNTKNYFPVEYCISSEKWEYRLPLESFVPGYLPATGEVSICYYTRWITDEVPLPPVNLTMDPILGDHIVESTALILQRIK